MKRVVVSEIDCVFGGHLFSFSAIHISLGLKCLRGCEFFLDDFHIFQSMTTAQDFVSWDKKEICTKISK